MMADEACDIKKDVYRFISAMLNLEIGDLKDEFDIIKHLRKEVERGAPAEDYLHFWKDYIQEFGIYDPLYDFSKYCYENNISGFKKKIYLVFFDLEIIGQNYYIESFTMHEAVSIARSKKLPNSLKRILLD